MTEGIRLLARESSMGTVHAELAERLNHSSEMIYAWRRGEHLPSVEIIETLARIFVQKGRADLTWTNRFLHFGSYGSSENITTLLRDLFGEDALREKFDLTSSTQNELVVAGTEDGQVHGLSFVPIRSNDKPLERRMDRSEHVNPHLPLATYSRLFGATEYSDRLQQHLTVESGSSIISIEGIGGIGKTALADYAVRQIIRHGTSFHDLLWVSAKQEYLTDTGIVHSAQATAQINVESLFDEVSQQLGLSDILRLSLPHKIERLTVQFRAKPYLVVIDNLETVADAEGLVPWLEKMARPTKFLLTSRQHVPALTTVTPIRLQELGQNDSINLVTHTAQEKQIGSIEPERIYDLVGGNPLAIILTVSQMQFLPADTVLRGIQRGTTEDIYRYVYWKSWSVLTDHARKVLLTFPRIGDQVDWQWLTMSEEFSEDDLRDALQQLIDLSLIQPQRGANNDLIYTIHRLTHTFLQTEVLGWK